MVATVFPTFHVSLQQYTYNETGCLIGCQTGKIAIRSRPDPDSLSGYLLELSGQAIQFEARRARAERETAARSSPDSLSAPAYPPALHVSRTRTKRLARELGDAQIAAQIACPDSLSAGGRGGATCTIQTISTWRDSGAQTDRLSGEAGWLAGWLAGWWRVAAHHRALE